MMGDLASRAGRKILAVVVLVIAGFVLFKIVLGFVTAVAWVAILVVAVLAIIWALRVL